MKQFLLPGTYRGERKLTLSGKDFHYLCRVRRFSPGETFTGRDSSGAAYRITMDSVESDRAVLAIEPLAAAEGVFDGPSITLFQCLPKADKIDLIVRQAAEAGVARVVLVVSQRSVKTSVSPQSMERLGRIVREARQQSGSPSATELEGPLPLSSILSEPERLDLALFFHQVTLEQGSLHGYLNGRPLSIGILIGPEGGLSDSEIRTLSASGFKPAYLGHNVLRVETAALFATAAVRTIAMEYETWKSSR